MATPAGAAPRVLPLPDAALLARLERLALLLRRPLQGRAAGERRSTRPGRSMEFADHRPYGAGDDLRYVDWNVYARTGRLYVKRFVDDEELCLHLLVDASSSMDWGEPSKFAAACALAAALGFLGLSGAERVGAALLRAGAGDTWTPGRGRARIPGLFDFLGRAAPGGDTALDAALAAYARGVRGGGVAVLISDLLDPAGCEAGLDALAARGLEVHLVHLLAPQELDPDSARSLEGELRLVDQETGATRHVSVDSQARAAYRRELDAFLARTEALCLRRGWSYTRVASDAPLEQVLFERLRGTLLK
jgi:uncharacterized protein (DUF58 family)